MTSHSFPAACQQCGQEYRVPDPEQNYSCRDCEGTVLAVEETSAERCPSCEEPLEAGQAFCPACGEGVGEDQEEVPGKSKERRRQASRQLVKAFGFLKLLRVFFLLGVFISLLAMAGTLFLVKENIFPLWMVYLVFLMHLGIACVKFIGARMVFYRPLFWSVLLAGLVTLARTIDAAQNDFSPVWTVGGLIWAGLFWALVPATARVRRLIEENPDLHIARMITGSTRRSSGLSGKELLADQKLAERRAWRKSLMICGGGAVVSLLMLFTTISQFHRPGFEKVWENFQSDWESGDPGKVASWFPFAQRAEEQENLMAIAKDRNWGDDWPPLEDAVMTFDEMESREYGRQRVEADIPTGQGTWMWASQEQEWELQSFTLPPPDFERIEKEWVEGWNRSDYTALARYFVNPERSEGSLQRMASRRDWSSLPRVMDATVEGTGSIRKLELNTNAGMVVVSFRLVDNLWVAASVKPPKS